MLRYLKLILVSFGLVIVLLFPGAGQAAVISSESGSSEVSANQTVDDDLYISGEQVVIDGTVNGDIYAAGSSISIKGTVNGSVFAAGQDIFISGAVTGGVRAAGQSVRITSPAIGGGVTAFSQNLTIDNGTVISGGLTFASSNAIIRGSVAKSVSGAGSKIVIDGSLGKDLYAATGDLVLNKTALINGNLHYYGSADLHKQQGARVVGATHHTRPSQDTQRDAVAATVFSAIWGLIAIYLVGAVLLWLAPQFPVGVAAEISERPLASLGWGVVALLITPPLMILLLLTLIGIPMALILGAAYILGLYLAHFWVGLALGEWGSAQAQWRPNPYANAFLGLLALTLIELLPFIGGTVAFLVVIIGLGGLVLYAKRIAGKTARPAKTKAA